MLGVEAAASRPEPCPGATRQDYCIGRRGVSLLGLGAPGHRNEMKPQSRVFVKLREPAALGKGESTPPHHSHRKTLTSTSCAASLPGQLRVRFTRSYDTVSVPYLGPQSPAGNQTVLFQRDLLVMIVWRNRRPGSPGSSRGGEGLATAWPRPFTSMLPQPEYRVRVRPLHVCPRG